MIRIIRIAAAAMVLSIFASAPAGSAAQSTEMHHHGFGDAEKWSHIFDDPARDAWQKPHEVIVALAPASDAVIADIGSGTGYFAVRLANMVPKGRVYGVDVEPDMVKYLAERAQKLGLKNLVSAACAPDDPQLPEKVDLVLMVDVLHHISDREHYLPGLRRYLKPGGRVAVIDFQPDAAEGPPPEMRIAPERTKAEFEHAGYRLDAEHGFLPRQYFLVFR